MGRNGSRSGTNGFIPNIYVFPVHRSVSSWISGKVAFRLNDGFSMVKSKVLAIERRKIDQYGVLGGSLIEVDNQSRQLFASGLQNGTLFNIKCRLICRAS